jgi:hypothetical protein
MARKEGADGERQTSKAKTGPRFSREAVTVRNQWRGEGTWVSEQVGATARFCSLYADGTSN